MTDRTHPLPSPTPLLLADIGATNARFALTGTGGPDRTRVLACADFPSLEAAVRAFLAAEAPEPPPRRAAFAVAGPVTGDAVTLTNLSWSFSASGLGRALGLERLEVVNDFTAVALALPRFDAHDLQRLGGGDGVARAPLAVLGPGSGLGVSGLLPVPGGGWLPLSGEGGHVSLAPANERESAVLSRLRQRFGPVSAERVLSGPGLVNLHRTLCDLEGREAEALDPADVTGRGLAGTCPHCVEALELFAAFLGTVAGNLALTLGARGGVFIAGGIAPRLGDFLARSAFRRRFEEKGPQQAYLAPIPVFLITHPLPAFLGLGALLSTEGADRP
ncbi:MAG: glucokinase [Rhodospirillaceae bacterium]